MFLQVVQVVQKWYNVDFKVIYAFLEHYFKAKITLFLVKFPNFLAKSAKITEKTPNEPTHITRWKHVTAFGIIAFYPQQGAIIMTLTKITLALAAILLTSAATAAAKLPSVQTYTPPLGVDGGCGKGKPVYSLDGKKFCQPPKQQKYK